jgi:hypothetical protein
MVANTNLYAIFDAVLALELSCRKWEALLRYGFVLVGVCVFYCVLLCALLCVLHVQFVDRMSGLCPSLLNAGVTDAMFLPKGFKMISVLGSFRAIVAEFQPVMRQIIGDVGLTVLAARNRLKVVGDIPCRGCKGSFTPLWVCDSHVVLAI